MFVNLRVWINKQKYFAVIIPVPSKLLFCVLIEKDYIFMNKHKIHFRDKFKGFLIFKNVDDNYYFIDGFAHQFKTVQLAKQLIRTL